MGALVGIVARMGSKGATPQHVTRPKHDDTAHALALQLLGNQEALRLSLELFEQIREAGLEPNDPRVESLPAAIELAACVARNGAIWD